MKKKETNSKKRIWSTIIWEVIWLLFLSWLLVIFVDFLQVRNKKEPIFCWNEKVITCEDGTVTKCSGLGYKVFQYNRNNIKSIEMGSFWNKERTCNDK